MGCTWQTIHYIIREATVILLLISVSLPHADSAGQTHWTYKSNDMERGPDVWYSIYPDCGGKSQSPIMINTSQVIYDPRLQPLDFSNYYITEGVKMKLKNVGGRTVKVLFSGRELFLKGGSFRGKYQLKQCHFHWGWDNQHGSEHSINGKFFPLEIHCVHQLEDSSSATTGSSRPNSLAVLAFLFKLGRENENYKPLLQNFDKIQHPNDETDIPTFPVIKLLPWSGHRRYFRYHGSLTIPPCSEIVTWTIGTRKIEISKEQLYKFRSLFDENRFNMMKCFRPLQKMHNRTIFSNRKKFGRGKPNAVILGLVLHG